MRSELGRVIAVSLLMLGVAYFAAGCGAATNPNVQSTPVLLPIPTQPTLSVEQTQAAVAQYYHEMAGSNPKATGSFYTSNGIQVNWINFTQYSFDGEAGKRLYDFLVNLVAQPGFRTSMTYQGRTYPAYLLDRATNAKTSKQHKLFVVGDGAPRPSIVPGNGFPSGLSLKDGGDVPASYIQARGNTSAPILNLSDPVINTNASVAAEICNNVGIAASQSTPLADIAQEGICNSIRIMYAAKTQGFPYDEYLAMAKRLRLGTFQVDVIGFERQDYDRTPVQKVITK